jgi:hypothetical protein
MGLDISAYRKITKIDAVFDAGGEPIDPTTREPVEYDMQAYINPEFPGRADDIEDRAIYKAEDSMGLRAGSYSGFNAWRNDLAKLAGYPLGQYEQYGKMWDSYCAACWNGAKGPFSELINFSDCEGVIGSAVAAKLAKDFADFQEVADKADDQRFTLKYAEWRKAFEMAADAGAVTFH